jgi:hypothetical protein
MTFIALTRITTADGAVLAEIGETCERVPIEALADLEASGQIRRVDSPIAEVLDE